MGLAAVAPDNAACIRLLQDLRFDFGTMLALPGSERELELFPLDLN